jgi:hypothetical protein
MTRRYPGPPYGRRLAPAGAGEDGSERTLRCVSERPEPATRARAAPAARYWTERMVLASDQCFSRP